jgi:hypothetical protein
LKLSHTATGGIWFSKAATAIHHRSGKLQIPFINNE